MNLDTNGNNIIQLIISDVDDINEADSETTKAIRQSLSVIYEDKRITVLSKYDIEDIISTNFEDYVLKAYRKLEPYSYKADLAKFCILYKFGGMTIDLPIMLTQKLTIPEGKHIFCFRDAYGAGMSPWAMATNLILARPGREEMRYAIDLIVRHCQGHYYGAHCLDPTGPGVFGRALAAIDRASDLHVGEFRHLTGSGGRGLGFIDPEGSIVGLRMKTIGADLSHIGMKGTNNYYELYCSKHIYGEPIEINHKHPKFFAAAGSKDEAGLFIEPTMSGIIVFGPYVSLNRGKYIATYHFGTDFTFSKMTIDVHGTPCGVCASKEYFELPSDNKLEIEFELQEFSSNIEVRLWADKDANGYCKGISIRKSS